MYSDETLRVAMSLRPIDDDFMKLMFQDNKPLVEYVLRIFLDMPDLVVESSETQYDLTVPGFRSLKLDVLARDSKGRSHNIEVQRTDADACPQRARYHSAAIDTKSLMKNQKFKELVDNYVVFITEHDVIGGQKASYKIERTIIGTDKLFNDGSHIVYVNGSYKGTETSLEKLIHDFSCSKAEDMLCEPMAETTYNYKNTPEGVDRMCKAVEEYGKKQRQEGILDAVKKLIRKGLLSNEEIAETLDIPLEEVQHLAAQMS